MLHFAWITGPFRRISLCKTICSSATEAPLEGGMVHLAVLHPFGRVCINRMNSPSGRKGPHNRASTSLGGGRFLRFSNVNVFSILDTLPRQD